VVDGRFVVVGQVEESTDFSERECGKPPVEGWGGFWFDVVVRWVLLV
jgi:hypothetical protein